METLRFAEFGPSSSNPYNTAITYWASPVRSIHFRNNPDFPRIFKISRISRKFESFIIFLISIVFLVKLNIQTIFIRNFVKMRILICNVFISGHTMPRESCLESGCGGPNLLLFFVVDVVVVALLVVYVTISRKNC